MPKISGVIITYNEELYIDKCLASLRGVADEIVVVDSLSTDSTEKICENYNVRFIKHKFEGLTEQKSFATSQAKFDYVLSLDADEALSDELKSSILEIKDNLESDGYYFYRKNNYCGKWLKRICLFPDRHLRLFKVSAGKWKGPNPHDRFYLNKGTKSQRLRGYLLHWNYATIEEHMDRMNLYSTVSADELFRAGEKTGPCKGTLHLLWRFFRSYFPEGGFLNGHNGLIFCAIMAWSSFLKYSKLRNLNSANGKL